MADLNNGLGAMVKAMRKSQGMTQAALAAAAGLERTSVTNIERGTQMLTVKTINAIAAALGYEVRVRFVKAAAHDRAGQFTDA
jgi:transcriptional regulator with XRE-family HTH domain